MQGRDVKPPAPRCRRAWGPSMHKTAPRDGVWGGGAGGVGGGDRPSRLQFPRVGPRAAGTSLPLPPGARARAPPHPPIPPPPAGRLASCPAPPPARPAHPPP